MAESPDLRAVSPTKLGEARAIAHQAAQLLTRAARANLPAEPDDSHSNLGWQPQHKMFWSRPLPGREGPCFIALSFAPLALHVFTGGIARDTLDLQGVSVGTAGEWLDKQLGQLDLKPASGLSLPYELPAEVEQVGSFNTAHSAPALETLAAWFATAHKVLSEFAGRNGAIVPGPSAVRCWPHHFDIATYVGLEEGDFETAKGIGVGLSPGDETYSQPYFYINPWPHMDVESLPDAPQPGHWHTAGFVGAIAAADEVLTLPDLDAGLPAFIDAAFAIGRGQLGA